MKVYSSEFYVYTTINKLYILLEFLIIFKIRLCSRTILFNEIY